MLGLVVNHVVMIGYNLHYLFGGQSVQVVDVLCHGLSLLICVGKGVEHIEIKKSFPLIFGGCIKQLHEAVDLRFAVVGIVSFLGTGTDQYEND